MTEIPTAQYLFETVLANYRAACTEPFANHPLAATLRYELSNAIQPLLPVNSYVVRGSAGMGSWADTPWVAVFDPFVTTTAQEGYYVVYLFRGDGECLYLSLNQATTEVHKRVGARYQQVLEHQARLRRDLLHAERRATAAGPIDLGGGGRLTTGYEAGNIASISYRRGAVPDDTQLGEDLDLLLLLYRQLVAGQDALADASQAPGDASAIEVGTEGDRFRWHKRVERNSRLAKEAKKAHGTTCQVCRFSFEALYGELGAGYIEAHHLIPVSELAERPREVSAQDDFAVVCANCHRMLHRPAGRVMSIADLGQLVALQRGLPPVG